MERRALGLLLAGWEVRNAYGPMQANSWLMKGTDRIPFGRGAMVKLRDLGLIAYVNGCAAAATLTDRGRRFAENLSKEEVHAEG